ncbi:MAG TPA: Ig-like domain-containing protein [Thermoanaerobaculales bacterium]|nr:Ig-like domain-containing protein [Thermoanaerobaculales bacterium]HPA79762.1 Ig-like domain-containing protein [Thermoanaerobaculales bacterium]HQN94746.1 Ig-like domain-containing protein [Thermoanaerobaculales bacterium]HQP42373.1 Ig-like domain-containing protein [Thermoanaerobaculales bacterium]
MNRTKVFTHAKRLALGLAVLALAASPTFAQTTIDLCATTGTAEVTTGVSVPIWGFVLGSSCGGDATLPNPVLRVIEGETVTINLTNNLPEQVSILIPGQPMTATGGVAGHFTTEAAAGGGTVSYSFVASRPGTFLYQSATSRIRTHLPMGLYGALVVESLSAGTAYGTAESAYATDQVLVYSAIDPVLNTNPAGYGGARVSKNTLPVADEGFVWGWKPEYFLINGKVHPDIETIYGGAGSNLLLRFVNAGLETVTPTLGGGLYMNVIAEDASLAPVAFSQYGVELQPGTTVDAIVTLPVTSDRYALYDRSLNLSNGAATTGGMVAYIDSAPAPLAVAEAYATDEDLALVVGPPGVLGNDQAAEGGALSGTYTASLVSGVANGTLALAADGSFTYTPDLDFYGADSFSYRAVDLVTPGTSSNVATVTLTINPVPDAGPPVADAQSVATPIFTPLAITLSGSDPEGDLLTFALGTVAPANGVLSGTPPNVTYTPNAGFYGADSFSFTVDDGITVSAEATVAITVVPTLHFSTSGNGLVPGVAAAAPPAGGYDNADFYRWDGTAFSRVFDATVPPAAAELPLPVTANIDGLIVVDATRFYVSFAADTTIQGFGPVQDEDVAYYDNGTWSVAFDMTAAGMTLAGHNIAAFDIVNGILYFSCGAALPPGVPAASPPAGGDDADIYSWNGTAFSRVFDANAGGGAPLPANANVDGLKWIDATHFYLSFAAASTVVPGLGAVEDEDVVEYNSGTWTVYFNGTAAGLGVDAAQDIDAVSIP